MGTELKSELHYRPGKEGKEFGVPLETEAFVGHIKALLDEIQDSLHNQAAEFLKANIKDVESYEDLKTAVSEGFWARGPWAGK